MSGDSERREGTSVLTVRDVQYAYPRTTALRGVSLQVQAGEVVAVTGRSGSGKSTLLHVCGGLLRPQSGTVSIAGQQLEDLDDSAASALRRRQVGIILQHGQLVPELSVVDNVSLPLFLDAHQRAAARALALDWLAKVGVPELADAFPPELSGGQAQSVAVARALVTGPRLVLADEPTGSMDADGGDRLLTLLLEQCRLAGRALLVVTHDNRVAAAADREVRLVDGVVEHEAVLR